METTLLIVTAVIVVMIILYMILVGDIDKSEPKIVELEKPIYLAGIEINTSDKSIYKDVAKIYTDFKIVKEKNPVPNLKTPWTSINISKDYNKEKGTFTYIVGDVVSKTGNIPENLRLYEVPAIKYAVFSIKPKSKFAWGITMGRMKRFIYTQWLPKSAYKPSDAIGDFELHDQRSLGKNPEIDLYVGLKSE